MKERAIIFGVSYTGREIYSKTSEVYDVIAFCDSDKCKQGEKVDHIPIISPGDIVKMSYDKIIIGSCMTESIFRQLRDLGVEPSKIMDEFAQKALCHKRKEKLLEVRDNIMHHNVGGNVAEVGVYLGDFACKINEAFPDRILYLFDTFEGFAQEDILIEESRGLLDGAKKEFHSQQSIDFVLSMMPFKEKCIVKKGYFPETAVDVHDTFAFVSLDADLYNPILEGLRFFYPRLEKGGCIFVHDYYSKKFLGVKQAIDEYLQEVNFQFSPLGDNCSIIIHK